MATEIKDETTTTPGKEKFSLAHLPPEGHPQAGSFFYSLWQAALQERRRLELEERWMENHRLFRGEHHGPHRRVVYKNKKKKMSINLLFANIIRTVANITARNPVSEVVSTDGIEDGTDIMVSQKIKNWWSDTEQSVSLAKSALANEIYGITTEKSIYDPVQKRSDTIVLDAFSAFPAPGYYEEWNDCPYFCHAYPMNTALVQQMFGLKEEDQVEADDVYSLLGEDREDNRPVPSGTYLGSQNYPGNYTQVQHPKYGTTSIGGEGRALVIEIWIRDYSTDRNETVVGEKVRTNLFGEPILDHDTGEPTTEPIIEVTETPKYPGNIRVVTLTNRGRLVLDDKANPNVNPALPREIAAKTYLYDHLPFYKANSYEDTTSVWGFAAAEQVGDINLEIDEIVSRIANYIRRVTNPPLIIPKDTGITKEMITNQAGLILRPVSTVASQGIRYLQVPNLPSNFFEALEVLIKLFDRISAIEDADRGDVPNRVVSGAAIQALQERGAVLIRAKIRAIDYLVRMRGRCAISFFQNFGVFPELISAQGTSKRITGVDLAGREFNYVVESGSTVAKTSLQVQEQAENLYKEGAIDRQALLETLNFPNWKEIIERVGEGQLGQAIQILIQAGLPEDVAAALYRQLSQPQGGPGNRPQDASAGENGSTATTAQPPLLAKTEQGQTMPGSA